MAKSIKDIKGKLALSRLESQRELLADDLDLTGIAFLSPKLPKYRFDESIIAGEVSRTIEGASTVTLTVNDQAGYIRRSGRLASRVDIKIDGLWFRLVKVQKSGNDITLTFESREVAILRTYNNRRVIGWGKMRRARFAQILVEEVKEMDIPFICPDLEAEKMKKGKNKLEDKSKKEKADNRDPGLGYKTEGTGKLVGDPGLKVKGRAATLGQLRTAQDILDVGASMLVRRKILVCSIMTAIQESSITNLLGGHGSSVGVFQEIDIWGSVEFRRNVKGAARRFFEKATKLDTKYPRMSYNELCQAVQRSGVPNGYAPHRLEAERIVSAYGGIPYGGDLANANNTDRFALGEWQEMAAVDEFQFMRGRPKTLPGGKKGWDKENTWDCIQRLAEEVNWRCFEVSGKIYFTTEQHLFKSAARARISEGSPGVDWIDFDYDIGKHNATVTVTARLDTWAAPPGTIIEVFDSGPANGRWIVSEIRRSFFDPTATITCKKPRARLPEPKKEDLSGLWDNKFDIGQGGANEIVSTPGRTPRQHETDKELIYPFAAHVKNTSHGGLHDTDGKEEWGVTAIDFMAPAGTYLLAVEDMKVTRHSGHDPAQGPPEGPHGPFGWSIYATGLTSGTQYYMTHLGTRFIKPGQEIAVGGAIATIGNYSKYGGVSHVHLAIVSGPVTISEIARAPKARRRKAKFEPDFLGVAKGSWWERRRSGR
jgi:hypothetical protein